jgi:hypothetical protein
MEALSRVNVIHQITTRTEREGGPCRLREKGV